METVEEIEARVSDLFSKSDDLNAELYTLGGMAERIEFFSALKDLISEKDLAGDVVAVEVLSWAWEQLSDI